MKKTITIFLSLFFILTFTINSFASVGDYYTEDRDNKKGAEKAKEFGAYSHIDKSLEKNTFSFFAQHGSYTITDSSGNEKSYPLYYVENYELPLNSCLYRYTSSGEYHYNLYYLKDDGTVAISSSYKVISSYNLYTGEILHPSTYTYARCVTTQLSSVIYTDVPVFSNQDSCTNFLKNGNVDVSNSIVLPDSYTTESPLTMFVYQSDSNEYDFTLNWTQMDISSDIRSYVTLDIELLANNTEKKLDTVVLDSAYQTKNDNYLSTNVSSYMQGVKLVNYEDYVEFGFTVYNYPLTGNGIKSKLKHCYVYWTNHGIYYNENNLINADDIDDKGVKLPTETEYIQNGGIINMEDWYNSGGSGSGNFISGIFSGFGLLDGSLPAFISSTFSYVPDELWILIFAAVSGALVVGLFKLVVK